MGVFLEKTHDLGEIATKRAELGSDLGPPGPEGKQTTRGQTPLSSDGDAEAAWRLFPASFDQLSVGFYKQ